MLTPTPLFSADNFQETRLVGTEVEIDLHFGQYSTVIVLGEEGARAAVVTPDRDGVEDAPALIARYLDWCRRRRDRRLLPAENEGPVRDLSPVIPQSQARLPSPPAGPSFVVVTPQPSTSSGSKRKRDSSNGDGEPAAKTDKVKPFKIPRLVVPRSLCAGTAFSSKPTHPANLSRVLARRVVSSPRLTSSRGPQVSLLLFPVVPPLER
jgi:hypothetical protein